MEHKDIAFKIKEKYIKSHTTFLISGDSLNESDVFEEIVFSVLSEKFHNYPNLKNHIINNTFPNCTSIFPEDNGKISISYLKNKISSINSKPALEGPRVFWIYSLDKCNHFCLNSLLKVLEEPPKNTFIFLRVNRVGNVIPTIRSRCFHIKLPEVSDVICDDSLRLLARDYVLFSYKGMFNNLENIASNLIKNIQNEEIRDKVILSTLKKDTSIRGVETYMNVNNFIQNSYDSHIDQKMKLLSISSIISR